MQVKLRRVLTAAQYREDPATDPPTKKSRPFARPGPTQRPDRETREGPGAARLSVEEKTRVVLAVLGGEMTLAEAARRHSVTPQAVAQWRDRFLEAGKASGAAGAAPTRSVAAARVSGGSSLLGQAAPAGVSRPVHQA
jgi:transposase